MAIGWLIDAFVGRCCLRTASFPKVTADVHVLAPSRDMELKWITLVHATQHMHESPRDPHTETTGCRMLVRAREVFVKWRRLRSEVGVKDDVLRLAAWMRHAGLQRHRWRSLVSVVTLHFVARQNARELPLLMRGVLFGNFRCCAKPHRAWLQEFGFGCMLPYDPGSQVLLAMNAPAHSFTASRRSEVLTLR